jgi:hypothetical protein
MLPVIPTRLIIDFGRPPEFSHGDDERGVQQAATSQIALKGG